MINRSALIFGASGLVGSKLLEQLIYNPNYQSVISIGRKSLNLDHPKLKQVVADIVDSDLHSDLFNVDDVYCCLGTTIKKAKSRQAFRKVDFYYVEKIASLAANKNVRNFAVISSLGANKDSGNFYLKTKGEMEEALKTYNFRSLYIFRPSILLGKRKEIRFGEIIGKMTMQLFSFLLIGRLKKYKGVSAEKVAKSMLSHVISNREGILFIESNTINS